MTGAGKWCDAESSGFDSCGLLSDEMTIDRANLPLGTSVKCAHCASVLIDPNYVHDGIAHESVADHLRKFGEPLGWELQQNGADWFFVCPACIGGDFEPKAKCRKCGHRKIATRHCAGFAGCDTGVLYSHLHRICTRCNFQWVERPKDFATPTLVGICYSRA